MKKIILTILAVHAFFLSQAFSTHGKPSTWSEEVACIIYTHCTPCHRPGGIGTFSITNYEEAYNERFAIRYAVSSGSMPPWPVNNAFNKLAHSRNLNEWEIDRIVDWVNEGALRGNTDLEPPLPDFSGDQGEITESGAITLSMPEYTNTSTKDNYRCFIVDPGNTTDLYLKAWEVLPGNLSMVHHVLVFSDTARTRLAALEAADQEPGYASFGATGSNSSQLIGGWTPGAKATRYPSGMGALIPANAVLIFQVHYAPDSYGEKDATSLRYIGTNQFQRPVNYASLLDHGSTMQNGPLFLPANTEKTFYSKLTTPVKGTLISVFPHMHLLGKSMKVWGIKPNGDTLRIIDIPKWDFHWQGDYMFQKPLVIDAGTELWVEATYDNTANNPYNPNKPPANVRLGEGTADEMLLVYFGFLVPSLPGDANIVIDTSTVRSYVNGCGLLLSNKALPTKIPNIELWPNPVGQTLFWSNDKGQIQHIRIMDALGREHVSSAVSEPVLSIEMLPAGAYIVKLEGANGLMFHKRIVKH